MHVTMKDADPRTPVQLRSRPHDLLAFRLYCAIEREHGIERREDLMRRSWARLDCNERRWFGGCVAALLAEPGLIKACRLDDGIGGASDNVEDSDHADVEQAKDELAGLLYLTMERLDFGPGNDHLVHPWRDTSSGIKAGYVRCLEALLAPPSASPVVPAT